MIRAEPATRDVPIVMLTASRIETTDVVRAFARGVNDYVVKPFVVEEFRARVETLLRAGEYKQRADREQRRIATINQLSRALFGAGTDLDAIVGALASGLVGALADGCAIVLEGSRDNVRPLARHRTETGAALLLAAASAQRPPARGVVTLTRDGHSDPFDEGDLAAIATCLEITGLAIETAMRSEAERVATRFHEEISNAVRYGRPSSPIEIRISSADDRATITVHNELRDAPIPDDLRRTIFDPFDRGGTSGAREHVGGLGLGLYIVREIVVAHDGEIAVESNLDGTTFSVTLPVRVPT